MQRIRLSIIGFGTVGRWLAEAIDRRRSWLEAECGVAVSVVSVATRRDGFIHRDAGLESLPCSNWRPLDAPWPTIAACVGGKPLSKV